MAICEALVIGNGAYSPNLRLTCPPHDAGAVAKSLQDLNFHVTLGIDLTYDAAQGQINEFISLVNAPSTKVSLLYYSGHGVQIEDQNYIVPIDVDHFADQTKDKLVRVQSIVEKMSNAAVRIVLLDACRSNADARAFVGGKGIESEKGVFIDGQPLPASGLADMKPSSNTFIAFAAAPGEFAFDGLPGDSLSPFTASFVKYLDVVDLPISNLMSRVRQDVLEHTGERQTTWDQSSLMTPFYFNPGSVLLFTGNLMALVGLLLSMISYSLILLRTDATWPCIATASALPLISLAILLFGTQSVYSRLRGNFQAGSDQSVTVRDHFITSIQKGILGGYLGSQVAALLISALYYIGWNDAFYKGWNHAPEPFGAILLEITIATALTACVLGTLSLFFARVSIRIDGLELSESRSWQRVVTGSAFGGILAGILAAPFLMVYFWRIEGRPFMTPEFLLPGSILGASIIIFSIVNFDFERLSTRRAWTSAGSAIAALFAGGVVAGLVFGPLYAVGIVNAAFRWLERNATDICLLERYPVKLDHILQP